jgi:hypothetical protein
MKGITAPPWTVPTKLIGREAVVNGLIITTGTTPGGERELIGDFRNNRLPLTVQKANCALAAKAPVMAAALLDLEAELGDLPNSPITQRVYSIVQKALTDVRLTKDDPK